MNNKKEQKMASHSLVTKRSLLKLTKPSCLLLLSSSLITSSKNKICNINAFSTSIYDASHRKPLISHGYYLSNQVKYSGNQNSQLCHKRNLGTSSLLRSNKLEEDSSNNQDFEKQLSEFLQKPIQQFRKGDLIQVEVVKFGTLGATVEIIAHKSHDEKDLISENEEPLGYGLILQREIGYFRASRGGLDVVKGEILPAYVEWVRDDGKVDIALRKPGGKGKAEDLGKLILDKLKQSGGDIAVGDKSSPEEINSMFPGSSKASFKRAVAALYKKQLVQPGPFSTKLLN